MMTTIDPYLPYFALGALFGLVIGMTAVVGYLIGLRVAHSRYRALKIADRARYVDSIHACWEENRLLFAAERKACRKIDLTDGPGCMATAQIGKN